MKILIAGSTGFIGKRLGTELALKGHTIHILTRSAERLREQLPFACQIFEWNPEQSKIPLVALDGVEVVINLSGTPVAGKRWSDKVKESILTSRLMSTETLWSAINKSQDHKIHTFINASAIGYYGDSGETLVDENSQTGGGFLAEVCSRWEKGFSKGPEDIRKVVVRIGVVLGRDGGALNEMLPIFQKGLGGPLGNGQQWMSWIHLEDLVRLIIFAVENSEIRGIVNAVSPYPARNSEFTKVFAEALGVMAIFKTPSLALKAALGEMSEILLSSQKVSAQKIVGYGFNFLFSDLGESLRNLVGILKNGTRVFETGHYIDSPIDNVFNFFSDERNLETITPAHLNFHIIGKSTLQIEQGTLIDYKLKIHGIPAHWQTEIVDWQPNVQFVDIQKKGPYSLWHHTHRFKTMGSGTYMHDQVLYKLPMGVLGRLFAGALVDKDVSGIFSYRQSQMKKLFPYKG